MGPTSIFERRNNILNWQSNQQVLSPGTASDCADDAPNHLSGTTISLFLFPSMGCTDLQAKLDDEQSTTALLIARLGEETQNVLDLMEELAKSEENTQQVRETLRRVLCEVELALRILY